MTGQSEGSEPDWERVVCVSAVVIADFAVISTDFYLAQPQIEGCVE